MKTYVLTISERFPSNHERKGDPTYFADQILSREKIHTIRANYDFWQKRIQKIQEGKAKLSIRYWSGKPYNSKQVEICILDKSSGIGIQMLRFGENSICYPYVGESNIMPANLLDQLYKNDGLQYQDFHSWFKKYDLSKPMAIIQFTEFRYPVAFC